MASCVVAAESWHLDAENIEVDMKREVDAFRLGFKAAEDQEYQQAAAAHRDRLQRRFSVTTSFQERRAAQLAAVQPRPDDYAGGPVSWDGGRHE